MHFLYFVKIDRKEAETSREAINRAESILANNGFIFSEGFWGGGKCDWFVMGGRWSGTLSGLAVKDDFILAAHKLIASKAKDTAERRYLSDAEVTEYADDIRSSHSPRRVSVTAPRRSISALIWESSSSRS